MPSEPLDPLRPFPPAEAYENEVSGPAGTTIRASEFVWRPPEDIPPREWLFGRHLIRGFLSMTVAPGGVGKSSMVLVEALAMVTGLPLLGCAPPSPLRVWVWNGEDPKEELERRIAAACIHYRIGPGEIGGRLLVDSGRDVPIVLVRQSGGSIRIAAPVAKQLEAAIRQANIDVLIVDPFVTSHQVPENDTTAMNAVVATWRKIADATGCAVELVHHVSKAGAIHGEDMGILAARGAGAVIDGVRSARQLIRMKPDEAARFGIEEASGYFRAVMGKANLAPPERAEWRRMIGIPLNNGRDVWEQGDVVGVCTAWQPPDVWDGITPGDLQRVQRAIAACDTPPSESEHASDWVGFVLADTLGLDAARTKTKPERTPAQNHDRAKIRRMLTAWIQAGALIVKEVPDTRNGRTRKIICVGEPVTDADIRGH
ncbi:AAA family ATPase [Thioclava sp. FR2]|uniref:AAA family ATPase n=1 Tax=Thioclava sp. FR2 TaxID=3445780 RepID=UPI003EB9D625